MEIKAFLDEFKRRTGYDFSGYAGESLNRRLQKIQADNSLDYEGILTRAVSDANFRQKVVEDITVNTTELFRDPEVWINLYKNIYCNIPNNVTTTFWHIGCSVGLEVYSSLILLSELNLLSKVRVMATDLNTRVIEVAKKGVYPYNSKFEDNFSKVFAALGKEVKFDKYFTIDKKNKTLTVNKILTSIPRFIQQNMVDENRPFAHKVDIVFFRNVLIYFSNDLQINVMKRVYEQMYDGAYLILGKQEWMPLNITGRFEDVVSNVYRKKKLVI